MAGEMFYNKYKYLYSSLIGTAMNGVSAYPASGSYVDVSPFERVHVVATFGVIHNSDTPVVTVKCAESVSGTADVLDAALAYTPAPASDDALAAIWTIETDSLPTDHHFLLVATSGTLSNGSYIHVQMFGEPKVLPAVQAATVVDFQYGYAGGQADNS